MYSETNIYMLLSRRQNTRQNRDIKIANRCFENMAQFRYLGTTIINQRPVTVVERSKACTVFARSEPGIVGSNPTQGMDG
jgi:hypothetical protein